MKLPRKTLGVSGADGIQRGMAKLPKWAQHLIEKLEADVKWHKDRADRYHAGLLDRGEYKLNDSESFRVLLYEDDEGKYLEIAANANELSIEPRASNQVRARIKAQ